MMRKPKVAFVLGTRPEVVKLGPVVEVLREEGRVDIKIIFTGQHRDLARPFLQTFGVEPDFDLEAMAEEQTLAELTERLMRRLDSLLLKLGPDLVVVQGDTTTVLCGALSSFYRQIPVAHVEAGLRSGDIYNPFPEEVNRRLTDHVSTLHFAPTPRAKKNLLHEGINPASIFVTGNTVVDALEGIKATIPPLKRSAQEKKILLTAHRRENWGEPMRRAFWAVRRIAQEFSDVEVVYPAHPNPAVRKIATEVLGDVPRVRLVEPLPYQAFLQELSSSYLVLTDSGGVQEEAPSFGKPVLVLRERTERPELMEVGGGVLVGTNPERVYEEIVRLLTDEEVYRKMASCPNPFGDGKASKRICAHLLRFFGLPAPEVEEFIPLGVAL